MDNVHGLWILTVRDAEACHPGVEAVVLWPLVLRGEVGSSSLVVVGGSCIHGSDESIIRCLFSSTLFNNQTCHIGGMKEEFSSTSGQVARCCEMNALVMVVQHHFWLQEGRCIVIQQPWLLASDVEEAIVVPTTSVVIIITRTHAVIPKVVIGISTCIIRDIRIVQKWLKNITFVTCL